MSKKTAICDFIETQPNHVIRRKDLVRFIVNLNGRTYNPVRDRGYYSAALCPTSLFNGGFLLSPSKKEPRFLMRIGRGLYTVTYM